MKSISISCKLDLYSIENQKKWKEKEYLLICVENVQNICMPSKCKKIIDYNRKSSKEHLIRYSFSSLQAFNHFSHIKAYFYFYFICVFVSDMFSWGLIHPNYHFLIIQRFFCMFIFLSSYKNKLVIMLHKYNSTCN